jgi:multiple antibiotic resistance protein
MKSMWVYIIQLFIIVDPLVGVPVFLAITPRNTSVERRSMARIGCFAGFLICAFFIVTGPLILTYLGIKTSAVRICGGILLFLIALEMVYGRLTGTVSSPREERLAEEREDISIMPLAFPLLAGPGAVATCLIFANQAVSVGQIIMLLVATALVFWSTYLCLRSADHIMALLGNLGVRIMTRVMGLLMAFLAVEYVVDGVLQVMAAKG